MGLQVSDLILEDVSHRLTSFLKTQGIALCPWNQERIIYTLKGSGDPKNNRLYLEEMPPEASVLPSLCPSLLTVLDPNPNLSRRLILPKYVDPREGNEDPFAEPHPHPHRSRAANVEVGSPASPKPSKIPLPPPAPLHALPQLLLCNEGKGKKRPREQKGREPRWLAGWPWAARMSRAGGAAEGDCRGYN